MNLFHQRYTCISLNYDSTLGIEHGAKELELFLQKQKKDFLSQGILVNKFDLITHSMGDWWQGTIQQVRTILK